MSAIATWAVPAGLILATVLVAVAGGVASASAPAFYRELERPRWAPPARLFGPVWSVLYVLMTWAALRVWHAAGAHPALALHLLQLLLNGLWSWLFFRRRRGDLAFLEILMLWGALAATLAGFRRVDALAGWLLVPYLAWLSLAAALNWSVWRRNPRLLGGSR
jgi:translocator protein